MRSPDAPPKVSTLGVSVDAVKEQLLLLGHIIPDDVIKAFLDEGRLGRAPGSCMTTTCLCLCMYQLLECQDRTY